MRVDLEAVRLTEAPAIQGGGVVALARAEVVAHVEESIVEDRRFQVDVGGQLELGAGAGLEAGL